MDNVEESLHKSKGMEAQEEQQGKAQQGII